VVLHGAPLSGSWRGGCIADAGDASAEIAWEHDGLLSGRKSCTPGKLAILRVQARGVRKAASLSEERSAVSKRSPARHGMACALGLRQRGGCSVSIDPGILAAVQGLVERGAELRPLDQLGPEAARRQVCKLAALVPVAPVEVAAVEDRVIPGAELALRVYTPPGEPPFAGLVYFHGGGWVVGDLDTHDRICRRLCRQAGCVVVAVAYRLAPEHRYPASSCAAG
jgi:hypothetical protein